MRLGTNITSFSVRHYKSLTIFIALTTIIIALGAVLPSIWPEKFPFLNPLKVDTDPENMLPHDEPVRVFHDKMKKEFNLYDIVVLGVVNEKDPDGVFNPKSLSNIYTLTQYAKGLQWNDPKDPSKKIGVISVDVISPSSVDNIEQAGEGAVRFEWLMPKPPKTREEAIEIRKKAERLPFLKGTMVSEDGKAICIYLPITSKDVSYRVYSKLREKIAQLKGDDKYFITGLPVANDTFGVEMFKQMAISAPMAMLIIFLLMLFFFRKLILIISPMIVALVSVLCTMGLLVITGNTVHIMSSMIPIFIMPIAVLDSIHILSEFFDRYQSIRDRKATIIMVMEKLFVPMLYTSLTSAAGFASLALAPIPPVQVFGIFVAFGVLLAWLLTVTFIPAYVMFISEASLASFGMKSASQGNHGRLSKFLTWVGQFTYEKAKFVLATTGIIIVIAIYGINKIQINDNPVKWFTHSHPIRIADKVLNRHFGGTYMAYLTFAPEAKQGSPAEILSGFEKRAREREEKLSDLPGARDVFEQLIKLAAQADLSKGKSAFLKEVEEKAQALSDSAPVETLDAWDEAMIFLDEEKESDQIFKRPDVLKYISDLQKYLLKTEVVGKSNSISDIVKTVYRELLLGKDEYFRIPDSQKAVAQCLITYQNSHRPQDLWHFVTPDYKRTSLWLQLKSGDNKDMLKVEDYVASYIKDNPPPVPLKYDWFGLTYINVVWQAKMVTGMLSAFLGSFLVVFLMMTILFRSPLWGIMCMIPLTVTIAFIYGAVGIIGKDYDMPIAVLSSLTLGLAVDFAIHFLTRSRNMVPVYGSWSKTAGPMFEEPARAISRNIIVIAVGFLPLLFAPLVPYKTVGTFLATILTVAGLATLFILPALIRISENKLFPKTGSPGLTCKCTNCIIIAVTAVALVVVNVYQYLNVGITSLTYGSAIAILLSAIACFFLSKRKECARRTP